MDNSRQAGLIGYIAGFFDGEGSIGSGMNAGKTRNSFFLKLSFHQSNPEVLEYVRLAIEEVSGISTGVLQIHRAKYNRLSTRDSYTLSYQGSNAYNLARILLPWVIGKRDYLLWVISTWEGRWNIDGKAHNREFLQQQHDNRPGRRAAATTKRKGSSNDEKQ